MNRFKEYKHPNGYSAKLYGKSSLIICFKGKEVAHTGFRRVNTEDEIMELLESYPEFRKSFGSHIDEILSDDKDSEV